MFQLRARAFATRRGWSVNVRDGREIDVFDQTRARYLILHDAGHVLGSLRILPANGPTMYRDVFPAIFAGMDMPCGSDMAEISRFCVDSPAILNRRSGLTPNLLTRYMLRLLFVEAAQRGIRSLIGVHDLMMYRILRHAGCRPCRIGQLIRTDTGLTTMASRFDVAQVCTRFRAEDEKARANTCQ